MSENSEIQNPIPKLFTEAFRPHNLNQIILLPRVRTEVEKGLVDHLLIYGRQGIGKTCLSRIMGQFGVEPLTINASLYRGIDVIREKVIAYATSADLFGESNKLKVVILEECDNLTFDAWMSLRATIEQFHATVRFIANCNYIEKIPEPIQSRFNCICLEPQNNEEEVYLINEYAKRINLILNACKITSTPEAINKFIMTSFPDLRTLVKKIQQLYTRGFTELNEETLGSSYDCSALYQLILNPGNPWQNYQALVANWANKSEDAILLIGKEFPEYLATAAPHILPKLPLIIVEIANYSAQLPQAIDKFIVLLALIYKLQMIVNS